MISSTALPLPPSNAVPVVSPISSPSGISDVLANPYSFTHASVAYPDKSTSTSYTASSTYFLFTKSVSAVASAVDLGTVVNVFSPVIVYAVSSVTPLDIPVSFILSIYSWRSPTSFSNSLSTLDIVECNSDLVSCID